MMVPLTMRSLEAMKCNVFFAYFAVRLKNLMLSIDLFASALTEKEGVQIATYPPPPRN